MWFAMRGLTVDVMTQTRTTEKGSPCTPEGMDGF